VTTPYVAKWYFAMALDPIHIGSHTKELGIVDNTVVRDPNTNLPKFPATTLAGTCRSYTAMYFPEKFLRETKPGKFASCAGKTGEEHTDHCGQADCPVCVTYGFTQDEKIGFTSLVQFMDGQILFFPVHSMNGPVWVVSLNGLNSLVNANILQPDQLHIQINPERNHIQTPVRNDKINLGWILLNVTSTDHPLTPSGQAALKEYGVPDELLSHTVLVTDKLFGHVVNNNMEIRTSVAIDPHIGAAKKGALFNYEAVPRTTIFYFQAIYKDPRNFEIGGKRLEYDYQWIQKNVEQGMRATEYLGLGGMTSRGMGRTRFLNLES